MLSEEQLLELMGDLESDRIERTVSTGKTDKFAEAICAFSNDFPGHRRPGYLLIGVGDDGTPSGLEVTDQLLQNLAALRSDGNIQPLPAIAVTKMRLSDGRGEIAVVEVFPSDLPPVRYRGRIWIRVGPRRAVASEVEERRLSERRVASVVSFDARPCQGAGVGDLDRELFAITYRPNAVSAEVIEENHRDIEEQLAALRFFDLTAQAPTYAGILLFGKDPLQWISGASIQFVRFRGHGLDSEVETERSFSGDLLTLLRELDGFIPMHNQAVLVEESGLKERLETPYPTVAIREILMNAVMHRSYDGSTAPIRFYWFCDHIEIQSPGGLFGEATPENFPRQNAYRNPVLAEAMKVLGYVNKFGRGVARAQEAMRKNGNPAVEFEFQPTYFLATLKRQP